MVIRRPATGDYQNRVPTVEEMVLMEGKQGQQAKIILLRAEVEAEEVLPTIFRLILPTMTLSLQHTSFKALRIIAVVTEVMDEMAAQQLHQATLHLIHYLRCGMAVALAVTVQVPETVQQLARVQPVPLVPPGAS